MHHWSCRPGAIGEIADVSRAKNVLIFLRGRSINANDVENLKYTYIYVYMCVGHTRTNTLATLPTIRSIRHSSNRLHQTNTYAS